LVKLYQDGTASLIYSLLPAIAGALDIESEYIHSVSNNFESIGLVFNSEAKSLKQDWLFTSSFDRAMKELGIQSKSSSQDRTDLKTRKATSKLMKRYRPDIVLTINTTDVRRVAATSSLSSMTMWIATSTYEDKEFRYSKFNTIWTAKTKASGASDAASTRDDYPSFAKEIAYRIVADGILKAKENTQLVTMPATTIKKTNGVYYSTSKDGVIKKIDKPEGFPKKVFTKRKAGAPQLPLVFYLIFNGEREGPHNRVHIEKMLSAGRISQDTLAWKEGSASDWTPISQVLAAEKAEQ